MWLMTTDGFLSAVEDRDDDTRVVVRARAREDAERFAAAVAGEVLETPHADYRFRVRTTKRAWASYVAGQARVIDYDNFKDAVADRQGYERARVYGEVWSVLRALTPPASASPTASGR